MTSALDRLAGPGGPLAAEPPDQAEIDGLIRAALKRLGDARNTALALESRFDLAYNAAHGLSLAALRYRGFRSSKRYTVFQVLPHTLGLGPEVWRVLAKAHEVRNKFEYEGEGGADARLVTDLLKACEAVAAKLSALPPLREGS